MELSRRRMLQEYEDRIAHQEAELLDLQAQTEHLQRLSQLAEAATASMEQSAGRWQTRHSQPYADSSGSPQAYSLREDSHSSPQAYSPREDSHSSSPDSWDPGHMQAHQTEVLMSFAERVALQSSTAKFEPGVDDSAYARVLTEALRCGNHSLAKVLIGGASLDTLLMSDTQGRGFLHALVLSNAFDLVLDLANRGIDLDEKDNQGQTALHLAVDAASARERSGDERGLQAAVNVIRILLQLGASYMIQDDAGRYPLTLAATAVSGIVEDEICMLEELGIRSVGSLSP